MLDNSTYEATSLLKVIRSDYLGLASLPSHITIQKSYLCAQLYFEAYNYEAVLPALLSDSHSQDTIRSLTCREFCVPSHSTCADEHSFYYAAAMQLNNLPFNLSLLESMSVFKSNVTK